LYHGKTKVRQKVVVMRIVDLSECEANLFAGTDRRWNDKDSHRTGVCSTQEISEREKKNVESKSHIIFISEFSSNNEVIGTILIHS
jgi:hypothetical protein